MSDKPRFNIGDVVYIAWASSHAQVQVPCPACFGKRVLKVELGDGSVETVDCQGCDHGYKGPEGWINEWAPTSGVYVGAVNSVSTGDEGFRYGTYHRSGTDSDTFATQEEAEKAAESLLAEAAASAESMNLRNVKDYKRKVGWEIRYHKEAVKKLERELAYHRKKLHRD